MTEVTDRQRRPFGLWDSPVDVADVTDGIGLRAPMFDTDGRTLVWMERRGAASVLVCRSRGEVAPRELAAGHRVRTKVFYGGGEFTVARGCLYFVDDGSRLFAQPLDGGRTRPLTPTFGQPASPTVSHDGRWVAYVHSDGDTDRIALVDTEGRQWPQWLAEGADFYMQPTWHPRGRMLAWVEWDFPNMAWDGTRLRLADLRLPTGSGPCVTASRVIAGGDEVSVFQPEFSPDGRFLAYASDEDGDASRLYLRDLQTDATVCLTPEDEGDIALPGWAQGLRTLAFSADSGRLYFTRNRDAERRLFICDLSTRDVRPLESLDDYACVSHLATAPRGDGVAVVACTPRQPDRILSWRSGQESRLTVQARSGSEALPAEALSCPHPIRWSTPDGTTAHGIYYPPASNCFDSDGHQPLIVNVHGGPTSQSDVGYDAEVQYFVTRGWAVLLVNHRGSTGYGRRYMTALRGNWGVYDVEDAVGGARHLVDQALADADRLVISGGSAGGYTVLRALTMHAGFFRAGVCRYGISNLFALADSTHKFESRYNDLLLGPLPGAADRYRERSPLFAADALRDPVILFQGTEDDVVLRDQSDAIVESLRRRGIPHEYHVYEGEGHGFRQPETKQNCLRATEAFLRRHVLFA